MPAIVPEISSVTSRVVAGSPNNWHITISGSNFGTQAAYNGDSADLGIGDFTTAMVAGNTGDGVETDVTSWTNNQIVISALTGAYGLNGWVINPGNLMMFFVGNAQDGISSLAYYMNA